MDDLCVSTEWLWPRKQKRRGKITRVGGDRRVCVGGGGGGGGETNRHKHTESESAKGLFSGFLLFNFYIF